MVKDGRYDYIETGSLVSINRNVKDIVIPSEEHRINMYPMDFEEFLWAVGDNQLMPFIRMGADIRIKCLGCGASVLMPRQKFEKKLKKVIRHEEE